MYEAFGCLCKLAAAVGVMDTVSSVGALMKFSSVPIESSTSKCVTRGL